MKLYEMVPGLYFGAMPKEKDVIRLERADISAVMTLSKKRPPELVQALGEYRYCHIPDGKAIPVEQLEHAANIVVQWLKAERDVYVHCLAGRNRSALVAALAARQLLGVCGAEVYAAVKAIRPNALHNVAFANWLKELP